MKSLHNLPKIVPTTLSDTEKAQLYYINEYLGGPAKYLRPGVLAWYQDEHTWVEMDKEYIEEALYDWDEDGRPDPDMSKLELLNEKFT